MSNGTINAPESWKKGTTDPDTGEQVSLLRVLASKNTKEIFFVNDTDEISKTLLYVGEASELGVWKIKKITGDKSLVVRYATMENNPLITSYIDAWTDRLTLTYDRIENI